jgi:hypothetical protein
MPRLALRAVPKWDAGHKPTRANFRQKRAVRYSKRKILKSMPRLNRKQLSEGLFCGLIASDAQPAQQDRPTKGGISPTARKRCHPTSRVADPRRDRFMPVFPPCATPSTSGIAVSAACQPHSRSAIDAEVERFRRTAVVPNADVNSTRRGSEGTEPKPPEEAFLSLAPTQNPQAGRLTAHS